MQNTILPTIIAFCIGVLGMTGGACTSSIPLVKLQTKYGNEQSRYIEIQGMKVHYRDEGSGPTLILIHGLVSSLHTWDGWVEALKGKYRIIRLDIPGFGLTGPASWSEYNAENYLSFMKEFIAALGLERVSLAGNSLGGYIAWNFAAKYPAQVDKLILIDPASYPTKIPGVLQLMSDPVLGPIAEKWTPKAIFANNIKDIYGDPKKISNEAINRYYELTLREGNRTSCRQVIHSIKKTSTCYPTAIKRITAPTLLMWGRKDAWIPVAQTELWKKDLPSTQVIIYEGVGHIPMEEIPTITALDADRFLSDKINQVAKISDGE